MSKWRCYKIFRVTSCSKALSISYLCLAYPHYSRVQIVRILFLEYKQNKIPQQKALTFSLTCIQVNEQCQLQVQLRAHNAISSQIGRQLFKQEGFFGKDSATCILAFVSGVIENCKFCLSWPYQSDISLTGRFWDSRLRPFRPSTQLQRQRQMSRHS